MLGHLRRLRGPGSSRVGLVRTWYALRPGRWHRQLSSRRWTANRAIESMLACGYTDREVGERATTSIEGLESR